MLRSDKKRKEEKAVSLKDKNAERPELGRRKFIFVSGSTVYFIFLPKI